MTLFNLILGSIVMALVVVYVMSANAITANQLSLKVLTEQSVSLGEAAMTLSFEQAELENETLLVSFAQEHGMVMEEQAQYVFEGQNVAYRR